jgi:hypothetical protein
VIWADRWGLATWAALSLLIVALVVWGVIDFYLLGILAELPHWKRLFTDADVGLAQPALSDWIYRSIRIVVNAGLLAALPLWILLRIVDFACGGPSKRHSSK